MKTFEESLRELDHAQTDRQENKMHKFFSTLFEIVKKEVFALTWRHHW